jgi:hypothetical protein
MQTKHAEPKQPITVLGDKYYGFPLYHWREALMRFLDLVWSDKFNFGVDKRSEITKNNVRNGNGNVILNITTTDTLKRYPGERAHLSIVFDSKDYTYQSTGTADALTFVPGEVVLCGRTFGSRGDFESLLAQFARSKHVDGLVLPLTDPKHVGVLGMRHFRGRLSVGIQKPH